MPEPDTRAPRVHIDRLRLRATAGSTVADLGRGGAESFASQVGRALARRLPAGTHAELGAIQLRIPEAALGARPAEAAEAVARRIAEQLTQRSKP